MTTPFLICFPCVPQSIWESKYKQKVDRSDLTVGSLPSLNHYSAAKPWTLLRMLQRVTVQVVVL